MLPNERVEYSALPQRPRLALPNGKRLAVWVLVSIEEWDPSQPMPRMVATPAGGGVPSPDVVNWSWHEYGNRVGFWRMLKVFDEIGIRASMPINGSAIHTYGPIAAAARERNWEFIGHGYMQKSMQKVDDERAEIRRTSEAIRAYTGTAPRGWIGPGLSETLETLDILAEEGYAYMCDWVLDDQPVYLKTRGKPLLSIPFTQECNDIPVILSQQHPASEYRTRVIDQFDQLYADSENSARVMAIVAHPFVMGMPHRLRYLKEALQYIASHSGAVFMTAGEIHDWYAAQQT